MQWPSKVKLPLGDWSGESRENTMGVYGTQNILSNLLSPIYQHFKGIVLFGIYRIILIFMIPTINTGDRFLSNHIERKTYTSRDKMSIKWDILTVLKY